MKFVGPRLVLSFSKYWSHSSGAILNEFDFRTIYEMLVEMGKDILIIAAPFLLAGMVMAFLATKVQFKWMVTLKPMQPKLKNQSNQWLQTVIFRKICGGIAESNCRGGTYRIYVIQCVEKSCK